MAHKDSGRYPFPTSEPWLPKPCYPFPHWTFQGHSQQSGLKYPNNIGAQTRKLLTYEPSVWESELTPDSPGSSPWSHQPPTSVADDLTTSLFSTSLKLIKKGNCRKHCEARGGRVINEEEEG